MHAQLDVLVEQIPSVRLAAEVTQALGVCPTVRNSVSFRAWHEPGAISQKETTYLPLG